MNEVLVLGAGIAGISACYHARQAGLAASCFEAKASAGGLVANFEIDGFRFDNAVHLSFSKDDYVNSLFLKTPYITHTPSPYCYDDGYWLKHPVQNNLYPLPVADKIACIESFVARPDGVATDYQQWLLQQYGVEIASRYPLRYTTKYWGLAASRLSVSWIGDRMRRAALTEILQGAFEPRQDQHYYASQMRYPKQGGYFAFIKDIAESIPIQTNKTATKIDVKNRAVHFSDGTVEHYQQLINTLPLPALCRLLVDCPEEVHQAGEALLWTRVDLISVGLSGVEVPKHLWFYIYDEEQYAARAYSPSLKSPNNAPDGCSSLQFEVYSLSTSPAPDPQMLIANVKQSLIDMKIATAEQVLFCHHKQLPFGNVVFDLGMEDRRDKILQYLQEQSILTAGRFGCWDYYWSDQSFLSGMKAAQQLTQNPNPHD